MKVSIIWWPTNHLYWVLHSFPCVDVYKMNSAGGSGIPFPTLPPCLCPFLLDKLTRRFKMLTSYGKESVEQKARWASCSPSQTSSLRRAWVASEFGPAPCMGTSSIPLLFHSHLSPVWLLTLIMSTRGCLPVPRLTWRLRGPCHRC